MYMNVTEALLHPRDKVLREDGYPPLLVGGRCHLGPYGEDFPVLIDGNYPLSVTTKKC